MGKANDKATTTKAAPKKATSTSGKPTNMTKIMNAIATQYGVGKDKPEKNVVQGLAGIPNKKIFDTVCGALKNKKQWITYDKDTIEFTELGRQQVPEEALQVPTNNDALHDKIKESFKNGSTKKIFDFLSDGRYRSKKEIADFLGMPVNKSFGTYLSGISKHSERNGDMYRLSDKCFLVGRPCDKEEEDEK
jgi:hypothetical protein